VENRESMAAAPDSLSRLSGLCADACPRSESANCEDSKRSKIIEIQISAGGCEMVVTGQERAMTAPKCIPQSGHY